ncbi:hypothetical protein WUBG_07272 [Wuchereria bancrofti]|uniref:Uncharacterized protein n=1 Tax=Wuchereria bancrofti TaxID=6293 RepID=J9F3B2_WUCBA|nr:hypothetical protein WUBG_07272 [Wuchereria bancrofti]
MFYLEYLFGSKTINIRFSIDLLLAYIEKTPLRLIKKLKSMSSLIIFTQKVKSVKSSPDIALRVFDDRIGFLLSQPLYNIEPEYTANYAKTSENSVTVNKQKR